MLLAYQSSTRSILIVRNISILRYYENATLFSKFCFNSFLVTFRLNNSNYNSNSQIQFFFWHIFQIYFFNMNKKTRTRKSWQPTFLLGVFLGCYQIRWSIFLPAVILVISLRSYGKALEIWIFFSLIFSNVIPYNDIHDAFEIVFFLNFILI
jgi:hypothetical protein